MVYTNDTLILGWVTSSNSKNRLRMRELAIKTIDRQKKCLSWEFFNYFMLMIYNSFLQIVNIYLKKMHCCFIYDPNNRKSLAGKFLDKDDALSWKNY